MSTANIEIYNMLVAAGLDKEKAEAVAVELMTKTEAKEVLATKSDVQELKISLMTWFTGMLLAQAALIVALIQLFD
ncbi:MAG: hypothetical protein KBC35_01970 [Candidatus Pacebacteria bacterium]|jgi:hypothetical protein|nr:hypothetical protein [Candidatus Paceibacterota bacterium]